LGFGVLMAVLVGAGALSGIDRRERHDAAAEPPAAGPAARASGDDEPAPEGWRRGSPGPLRHRDGAVEVWTGTELVVWGGDPNGDSGAAYDPAADRWREIAPSPIPALCQAAASWSGREVLMAGPSCTSGAGSAAAAYDPAADRWRTLTLSSSPLLGGAPAVSAWTGTEWVVVSSAGPAAALDPAAGPAGPSGSPVGRWRALAAAPRSFATATFATAVWTGRELVVFGNEFHEKGPASAGPVFQHWAATFDPAPGRWRTLPEPPFELAATSVWDGRRLVAWDQNLHAAALEPGATTGWQALPDVPVDFTDCSPRGTMVGDAVFAEECGRGALFRPATGAWERIHHPLALAEPPIWTGHDALFWVGSLAGSADGVWLYRPPAETPGPDGRHRSPVPLNRRS
jgi:hypothetical protein